MFKETSSLWQETIVEQDSGSKAWEIRGWEVCGRWERRGRKALEGGEKCDSMLTFLIQQCIRILSKTRTQNVYDLHLTSQSLLRLLSKQANKTLL